MLNLDYIKPLIFLVVGLIVNIAIAAESSSNFMFTEGPNVVAGVNNTEGIGYYKYPKYQIEIIVFRHLHNASSPEQESFAENCNPGKINKHNSVDFNSNNTQVKWLLNDYNKLKKKSNYKIILYAATVYDLLPSQKNKKFLIKSDPEFSENSANESNGSENFIGTLTITPVRNTFNLAFDGIFSKFRLTKSAKIKPKETYYFDHPMFGALITMFEIKDN